MTAQDIVVTRRFGVPVERVWVAWTDSDHVRRWWGPRGFDCPVAEMDVREGSRSLVCMRSPEGTEFYNTWTYALVRPPERLEFEMGFADASGAALDPADLGLPPDIPHPVRHVVTMTEVAGGTELTVTEFGYTTEQTYQISKAGLEQCLDKMAEALE
jgi:uncharacterized protein YndB with AHSA1/START domain